MKPNVIPLTPQGHFVLQLYHKTAWVMVEEHGYKPSHSLLQPSNIPLHNLRKKVDHLAGMVILPTCTFLLLVPHPHRKQQTQQPDEGQEREVRSLVLIPSYMAAMSKDIRCVCTKFKI